jgi:ABC-type transporter Mla MlaB component
VSEQTTISIVIRGPIARPDLPGLCDHVIELLEASGATIAVCDVGAAGPDAVSVDALARIGRIAREHGCDVRVRGASDDLRTLIAFMGLQAVLLDGRGPGFG